MRLYFIGRGYQAADVEAAEAARRFLRWLADDANPVLTELIQSWLCQPADRGGLGALAESAWEIAVLRAEVTAAWRRAAGGEAGR